MVGSPCEPFLLPIFRRLSQDTQSDGRRAAPPEGPGAPSGGPTGSPGLRPVLTSRYTSMSLRHMVSIVRERFLVLLFPSTLLRSGRTDTPDRHLILPYEHFTRF